MKDYEYYIILPRTLRNSLNLGVQEFLPNNWVVDYPDHSIESLFLDSIRNRVTFKKQKYSSSDNENIENINHRFLAHSDFQNFLNRLGFSAENIIALGGYSQQMNGLMRMLLSMGIKQFEKQFWVSHFIGDVDVDKYGRVIHTSDMGFYMPKKRENIKFSIDVPTISCQFIYLEDGSASKLSEMKIADIYLPLLFSDQSIDFLNWFELITGQTITFWPREEFYLNELLIGKEHKEFDLEIKELSHDEKFYSSLLPQLLGAFSKNNFRFAGLEFPDIENLNVEDRKLAVILNRYIATFIGTLPDRFLKKFSSTQALIEAILRQWYQHENSSDIVIAYNAEKNNIVFQEARRYELSEKNLLESIIDRSFNKQIKEANSSCNSEENHRRILITQLLGAFESLVGVARKFENKTFGILNPEIFYNNFSHLRRNFTVTQDVRNFLTRLLEQTDPIEDKQWKNCIAELNNVIDPLTSLSEISFRNEGKNQEETLKEVIGRIKKTVYQFLTEEVQSTIKSRANVLAIQNAWRVDLTNEEQNQVKNEIGDIEERCLLDPRIILIFSKNTYITKEIYQHWNSGYAPLKNTYALLDEIEENLQEYYRCSLTLSNVERKKYIELVYKKIREALSDIDLPNYMRLGKGSVLNQLKKRCIHEINYLREINETRKETGLTFEFLNKEKKKIEPYQEKNIELQRSLFNSFKKVNDYPFKRRDQLRDYTKLVIETKYKLAEIETIIERYLSEIHGIRLSEIKDANGFSNIDYISNKAKKSHPKIYSCVLALGIIERFRQNHGAEGLEKLENIEDYQAVLSALQDLLARNNADKHWWQKNRLGDRLKAILSDKSDKNFNGKATFSLALGQSLEKFENEQYQFQQAQRFKLFRDTKGKQNRSVLKRTVTSHDAFNLSSFKWLNRLQKELENIKTIESLDIFIQKKQEQIKKLYNNHPHYRKSINEFLKFNEKLTRIRLEIQKKMNNVVSYTLLKKYKQNSQHVIKKAIYQNLVYSKLKQKEQSGSSVIEKKLNFKTLYMNIEKSIKQKVNNTYNNRLKELDDKKLHYWKNALSFLKKTKPRLMKALNLNEINAQYDSAINQIKTIEQPTGLAINDIQSNLSLILEGIKDCRLKELLLQQFDSLTNNILSKLKSNNSEESIEVLLKNTLQEMDRMAVDTGLPEDIINDLLNLYKENIINLIQKQIGEPPFDLYNVNHNSLYYLYHTKIQSCCYQRVPDFLSEAIAGIEKFCQEEKNPDQLAEKKENIENLIQLSLERIKNEWGKQIQCATLETLRALHQLLVTNMATINIPKIYEEQKQDLVEHLMQLFYEKAKTMFELDIKNAKSQLSSDKVNQYVHKQRIKYLDVINYPEAEALEKRNTSHVLSSSSCLLFNNSKGQSRCGVFHNQSSQEQPTVPKISVY